MEGALGIQVAVPKMEARVVHILQRQNQPLDRKEIIDNVATWLNMQFKGRGVKVVEEIEQDGHLLDVPMPDGCTHSSLLLPCYGKD